MFTESSRRLLTMSGVQEQTPGGSSALLSPRLE